MAGPWFLYLDESGDLGFDPDKKGRSRFFTICILAVSTPARNRALALAVRKTIKRLLNPKGRRKRLVEELKGNATSLRVKEYFFRPGDGGSFRGLRTDPEQGVASPGVAKAKRASLSWIMPQKKIENSLTV